MERTVPSTGSEEIDLYVRTYYSLLRSTAEIQIPAADEQVVVHGAEAQGPRDSQGQMILKPIERESSRDRQPPLQY